MPALNPINSVALSRKRNRGFLARNKEIKIQMLSN